MTKGSGNPRHLRNAIAHFAADSVSLSLVAFLLANSLPASTSGGVVIAVGLLLGIVFGAIGSMLALLERARFERHRAPYTFARRRKTRRLDTQVEIVAWVLILTPLMLGLATQFTEASAVPVISLITLGFIPFRSLWHSLFSGFLRAFSHYNAAGLAACRGEASVGGPEQRYNFDHQEGIPWLHCRPELVGSAC